MEPIIRPTSITVISWIWIITGILMILSGLLGYFSYSMMQDMSGGKPFPEDLPPEFSGTFKPMMIIFEHFQLFAVIQVIVATIAIISGSYFLNLRSWARTNLEILTWLALVYIVAFSIFWIFSWYSITENMSHDDMKSGMENIQYIGIIMATIINFIFAAPLVYMLIKLRGSVIRNAVH